MNPKLKRLFRIIILLWILWWILYSFFVINSKNYNKLREIKLEQINHPENLPTSDFARATSFGFENIKANIYWLWTIQYIWWNAVSAAYKKYLYKMIDLITDLNPYFINPYRMGMLLLPSHNHRYENLGEDKQLKHINQAEKLWLKWINNFCDLDKIKYIKKQNDLHKIWTKDKYKNPCKTYEIPFFLAFIYFFYLNDNISASNFYKISSAHEDSLWWAKILAAVMKWKWWYREKAFLMFSNIWKKLDNSEEKICHSFLDILQKDIADKVFKEENINSNLIKYASDLKEKVFWKFDPEKEHKIDLNNQCIRHIDKAIRELNLYYIERWNERYKANNYWVGAKNAKILFDKWYIQYLPVDYQQYNGHWIVYEYNPDTWFFDYVMRNF